MAAGQPPVLQKAVTCLPTESVRKLQFLLIESPTGVAVLLDRPDGQVLGVVTLHDLLRAQVSMAAENE
jgi:CBS domain-containing protein